MPIVDIDLDTIQPNGKPGDPARTAFTKVNSNFDYVENRLSDLSGGGSATSAALDAEVQARQALGQTVASQGTTLADNTTKINKNTSDIATTSTKVAANTSAIAANTSAISALTPRVDAVGNKANANAVDIATTNAAVSSLSTQTGLMSSFKNRIINGDFRHWQRGTSFPSAQGARYCADRWLLQSNGSVISANQVAATSAQLQRSRTLLSLSVGTAAGAGNYAAIQTRLEGAETLAGGKATLSFWAEPSIANAKLGVSFIQRFGTGGSAASTAVGQLLTIAPGINKYSVTVDLPSVAGKTFGSGSYLEVTLWMDAGSSQSAAQGVDQKSWAMTLGEVQLEAGNIATSYEYLPDSISRTMVNRYYEVMSGVAFTGTVYTPNGEVRGGFIPWSSTKRVAPSVSYSGNPSVFAFGRSSELTNANPGTLAFASNESGFRVNSMSNFANFQGIGNVCNVSSGSNITVIGDAEL